LDDPDQRCRPDGGAAAYPERHSRLSTNRPEPGGGFRRAGWRQWTGDGDQTRHEAIKSRLLPKFSFPINRPERVDWLISGRILGPSIANRFADVIRWRSEPTRLFARRRLRAVAFRTANDLTTVTSLCATEGRSPAKRQPSLPRRARFHVGIEAGGTGRPARAALVRFRMRQSLAPIPVHPTPAPARCWADVPWEVSAWVTGFVTTRAQKRIHSIIHCSFLVPVRAPIFLACRRFTERPSHACDTVRSVRRSLGS